MAQRQLSRTLPKNFTFPSLSTDEPKTPERPFTTVDVPPPPRHSFSSARLPRVRVRSGTDVCARMDLDLFQFRGNSDIPLPSIEVPPASAVQDSSFSEESTKDARFLAPPRQRMDFKTPPAQILGTPFDSNDSTSWPSWEQSPMAHNIPRPDSACSNLSDSSNESIETFASRASYGGSCSSIESDAFEPYFPLELTKEPEMESPTLPKQKLQRPQVKDVSWSREMDNHLWNTYQMYLQDPTMTPFKMTPGSIPPLGVTSRVARRAGKTWEKKKHLIASIHPSSAVGRSASSTPKAWDGAQSAWPKSDAKTRKRLKLLCRRKFSINPHYQRIMQSRTPEPSTDMLNAASQSRAPGVADNSSTTYGTRDLGVSLVSSYASTPLAQLAEVPSPKNSNVDWFNNPVQSHIQHPVTQPFNQSLHPPQEVPRLGSPFVYSTWGPGGSNRQVDNSPATPRRQTVHVPVARRTRRNTHFQRAAVRESNELFSSDGYSGKDRPDDDFQHRLEKYVHDKKFQDIGHGRVRVRSRGATTSAVSSQDANQLFSPPSSLNSSQAEETTPIAKPPMNQRLNLGGENIKRLGSPFKLDGGIKRREAPGRFIRHAPSLSDPFSSGGISMFHGPTSNPSPFQDHVKTPAPPLHNPFEEGLSDAERIRRQILNMPFSRQ